MDMRCYSCIEFSENEQDDFAELFHLGNGRFICPRCGKSLDLSEKTFSVVVKRDIEEKTLHTRILKLDSRLDDFYDVENDIWELFETLPVGKFDCEVYINWCMSCGEADCDTELFSYKKMEKMSIEDFKKGYSGISKELDRMKARDETSEEEKDMIKWFYELMNDHFSTSDILPFK